MSLIKSISGFRGTIGGKAGDNFTAQDIVECSAAFGKWVLNRHGKATIVVGRDGRISGEIVSNLAVNTLRMMGIHIVDLGLSTTPTVEIAVPLEQAQAGIIFTASHNPKHWNALKFLNEKGEFISAEDGKLLLSFVDEGAIDYAEVDQLGSYRRDDTYINKHIDQILKLPLVFTDAIIEKKYKIVVDCINSTGAISIPPLLERLGCEVFLINEQIDGNFAHNPEPLPENLTALSLAVQANQADLGIAVDPDVDRLVFVTEDGEMFGEEYTLVAVADFILSHKKGNTVSNLSSTKALKVITAQKGGNYYSAAVGEVNVVEKMKEVNAVIGGEGNGGIIYPDLHYGRDALVGIALFLSMLSSTATKPSYLRRTYPNYYISKNKIVLDDDVDLDLVLEKLAQKYHREKLTTIDGLKIEFEDDWVHLRKSNTEPIVRIYAESQFDTVAHNIALKIKQDIEDIAFGNL
ncbi:MAG: phosphoglucosamine mutase [Saprospiraceae bacterium]